MPSGLFTRIKDKAAALKREVLALWYAARDPRTPWYAKALAVLVTAYAFSPVDLVPDFIPVLGYLDDLVIIPAGIALTLKLIPRQVMEDARRKAADAAGRPVNWWAGAAIIVAWGVIVYFTIRAVVRLIRDYNHL